MLQEVILSDKEIIEKQGNEILELKELIKQKDDEISFLHQQVQQLSKCIIDGNIKDNSINNYKEYVKLKKNNEYILNKNKEMEKQIEELNIKINNFSNNDKDKSSEDITSIDDKIKKALDSQKSIFEKEIQEKDDKYNTLYNDFNKINEEFNAFKQKLNLPTPSNSSVTKDPKIKLPENLFEIIYYRYVNNNKYLSGYHTTNGVAYLECCGKQWDYKVLDNEGVTCMRCFKTYKLKDNKLINEILKEHIIQDEKFILNKIKCNNKQCNYIYKKEIDLCYKCKNIKSVKIIEYPMPEENDKAKETKIALAGKCYNNIIYINSIFLKAHKEGLVKNGWQPLIDYIKDNKLMEEKQINIIKNKIIRCNDITFIYNLDKYKNIQEFIKRLNFSLNSLSKLSDDDFQTFKYELQEKLDNHLEKIKNNENIKINKDEYKKERCNKCLSYLNDSEFKYCIKCYKLCQVDDCKNKKQLFGNILSEYCKQHISASFNIF